ncbi:MAG: hypothetical protein HKN73_09140 [Gemmatimonadetes bacterium]|nr:hypothetical protein [Gemmatimonadota bacterium]
MFHVYVIELDEAVWQNGRFRKANPQRDPAKPCVYVGQTYLTPEERLAQHRSGKRSNRYVRKFGGKLVREFTGRIRGATRSEAELSERWMARRLRGMGYWVWSR